GRRVPRRAVFTAQVQRADPHRAAAGAGRVAQEPQRAARGGRHRHRGQGTRRAWRGGPAAGATEPHARAGARVMALFDRDRGGIESLTRKAERLFSPGEVPEALLKAAQGKRFVLRGEATHGTAEFYRCRAEITRRLIEAGLCDAVAVEADWPDAYRLNRYVCN